MITTKAVLRFGEDGEAYLASAHPKSADRESDDIPLRLTILCRNTGWKLQVSSEVAGDTGADGGGVEGDSRIRQRRVLDEMSEALATITNHPGTHAAGGADSSATILRINVIDITMMEELAAALSEIEARSDLSTVVSERSGKEFFSWSGRRRPHSRQSCDHAGQVSRRDSRLGQHEESDHRGGAWSLPGRRRRAGDGLRHGLYRGLARVGISLRSSWDAIRRWRPPALAALVGQKHAPNSILTGRTISGREAASIGLANRALPEIEIETAVQETAHQLAKLSPAALAVAKKAMYGWDSMHFDKGLARAEKIYLDELMKVGRCAGRNQRFSGKARAGLEREVDDAQTSLHAGSDCRVCA